MRNLINLVPVLSLNRSFMFAMKKRLLKGCSTLAVVLLSLPAHVNAQFNPVVGEKTFSKWTELSSNHYQVIYPEGMDLMGARYSLLLEKYRPLVGKSLGFLPNQQFEVSLPIVLHPFTATTNGITALAPSRIEVYTFSDPYSMLPPLSWETLISIHENRHAAQLQFAAAGFWKWFPHLFGEYFPLYVESLYLNTALAEGDAVVAETALTNSGRGRTADFLSYYRMSFDTGDLRNWYRWRYGSQRYFTPDHYTIGYMTVAGARYVYDTPQFMSSYLSRLLNPFSFTAMESTLRSYSGKNIKNSWKEISGAFADIWVADDRERGPFQEIQTIVTDKSRYYSAYSGSVETAGGHLLSVRTGLDKAQELVEIMPDGSVKPLRRFGSDSRLAYSPVTDCIYWSEAIPDVRWEMYSTSRIRMMKVGSKTISDFTAEGRYVTPSVSDDGKYLAAAEYLPEGGARIVLFSTEDCTEVSSIPVQSGIMANEVAFSGSNIVFTGVSDDGIGLYLTDFQSISLLEEPAPFKVRDLISKDGVIYFTCDKTGTDEIYSYNPADRSMNQLTNSRYGVSDPFFRNGELCFSALQPQGRVLASSGTINRAVLYSERCSYPIADMLTQQENSLAAAPSTYSTFSPSRFRKLSNGLRLHSWMPIYSNVEGLTGSMTGLSYEMASLGATAYVQNLPTTLYGSLAISLHNDPFQKETATKAGFHVRLNYTGLFPVISLALDMGDRRSVSSVRGIYKDSVRTASAIIKDKNVPFFVGGSLTVSLPFNFSSGGWKRSLTPFAGILSSTDMLGEGYREIKYNENLLLYEPKESKVGGLHPTTRIIAGFSGGVELPVPSSAIYPRWGIGGGMQYSANSFTNSLYACLYGYLPGLSSVQGFKLQASMQIKEAAKKTTLADVWAFDLHEMAPRGYSQTEAASMLKLYYLETYSFSADYAMPLLAVDFALGQYAYLRNLELLPFIDYTIAKGNDRTDNLMSVGTDVMFRFEKLLILNNTIKLGFRFAYNDGSLNKTLGVKDPFYIGVVTNVGF